MKPIICSNLCSMRAPGSAFRAPAWVKIIVAAMLSLSSCHSHKHVVRGDQGSEMVRGHKPADKTPQGKHPGRKPSEKPPHTSDKYVNKLLDEAYRWIGTPYRYGGKTTEAMDCSGFVFIVFDRALGITLPRVSREQGEHCRKIKKSDLEPGDLVFFCTGSDKGRVNHVGIYVGDNNMIHASSSKGVCVTPIDSKYFAERYHHCGRVEELTSMRRNKRP